MARSIQNIPLLNPVVDPSSLLLNFLIGKGGFTRKENLDELKDVNLKVELENASEIQKTLIFSAIKFSLNEFYENRKYIKFNELALTGVAFEEIMNAPDIELNTNDTTNNHFFKSPIFDALLTGKMIFTWTLQEMIASDGKAWMLQYIASPYLNLSEKNFLVKTLITEPDLISNIQDSNGKKIITVTENLINQAKKIIMENLDMCNNDVSHYPPNEETVQFTQNANPESEILGLEAI